MSSHECRQEEKIGQLGAQADRVEKEIYVGRESRQPILVRVDRVERVVGMLTYVSTAVLIAVILGAGAVVFKVVSEHRLAAGASVPKVPFDLFSGIRQPAGGLPGPGAGGG